ncbi:hypothetical protein F5B20DRAFT_578158 [Whalleya microplaca]|nr:hypothetical protein F5B20DRAFT_578158 [Whalleya microplaca]
MKVLTSLVITIAAVSASAIREASSPPSVCAPGTDVIVNSTVVDGQVLYHGACQTAQDLKVRAVKDELMKRDRNVCGAPCTTYCNSGTGGPDPNDCSSLASGLPSGGFTLGAGQIRYWNWGSCQAYLTNKASEGMYECYDQGSLGGIINYLAWNCQASTSGGPYLGGSCHFYDNTGIGWVQVETY